VNRVKCVNAVTDRERESDRVRDVRGSLPFTMEIADRPSSVNSVYRNQTARLGSGRIKGVRHISEQTF